MDLFRVTKIQAKTHVNKRAKDQYKCEILKL
jgi:hypothetical protein